MFSLLDVVGPFLRLWLKLLSRKKSTAQGVIELEGLHSRVRILRDRWGVPHIYVENMHDLLFAQGYVHAQDRLWQMDFTRRAASGRLSEIFGRKTLDIDRWTRIVGLNRAARLENSHLDSELLREQQAYCEGINAFIKTGRLPPEFSLLGYEPDLWQPFDTLVWNKLMSWNLSVNWESELLRSRLIELLGPEREAELEPGYFDFWPTVMNRKKASANQTNAALQRFSDSRFYTGNSPFEGTGSNCWTISGKLTESGSPILCNDMHLVLSAPAIWYENHLVGNELQLAGITTPGIPFIVSGHNGRVAWGFTAGMSDVQDLYIERMRKVDGKNVQYEYMGKWHDAAVIHEEISVKRESPVVEEVLITRHGPVINALTTEIPNGEHLSLRWVGAGQDTTSRAMHDMLRSNSCREFKDALAKWVTPNLNVHYSDTEGNIAYTLAGKVPVRRRGDGKMPVPGWLGTYEWEGYIPFGKLPHSFNPKCGYIVSANNKVAEKDYPFRLGEEYCAGDRAARIEEFLRSKRRFSVTDMKKIHRDLKSPTALTITRHITKLLREDSEKDIPEEIKNACELLENWDGVLESTSPAAALYETFVRTLIAAVLSDELGNLTSRYMGKGPTPVLAEYSMFCWHSLEWLRKELEGEKSGWAGSEKGTDKRHIVLESMAEAVRILKKKLDRSVENWSWGKLHRLTFGHPLGSVRAFAEFFNRGPFPIGGDGTTVWASFSNMHDLCSSTVIGPPYRFIADLSDLGRTMSVLAPGQTGNPASSHYDDQIEDWFNGEYHTLLYREEEVRNAAVQTLKLVPLQ